MGRHWHGILELKTLVANYPKEWFSSRQTKCSSPPNKANIQNDWPMKEVLEWRGPLELIRKGLTAEEEMGEHEYKVH